MEDDVHRELARLRKERAADLEANERLRHAVEALINQRQFSDLPPDLAPRAVPADKFAHLPAEVRDWLDSLRKDDIETLRETMHFQRSTKTVGKFLKWAIIFFVTTFIGAVALGEKIGEAWRWLMGGGR